MPSLSEQLGVPNEPVDEEVLDALTQQACFAADSAYFKHRHDTSNVRAPDGSLQTLTDCEMTRVQIRAALRNLIANGLIKTLVLSDWPRYTSLD